MMKRIIAPVAAVLLAGGVAYAQSSPSGTAGEKSPSASSMPSTQSSQANMPKELTSDKLLDMKVVGPQGEKIGEVEQMVIDPKSGQVSSLVVSVGGFLGIGDKKVAMPWDQFTMGQNDQLVAQATKQQLEQAQAWQDPNQQQAQTREEKRSGDTGAPSTAPSTAPSSSGTSGGAAGGR